jgi:hypothetical protein
MRLFSVILAALLVGTSSATVLVDFGSSAAQNHFGLEGWNSVTLGPGAEYSELGGGGITARAGAAAGTDYIRINGTGRKFTKGDKILVTWYNNSSSRIDYWYPLLSFVDTDAPDDSYGQPQWYALAANDKEDYYGYGRQFVWVAAHGYGQAFYDVVDSSIYVNSLPGYISGGTHDLLNICSNWTQFQGNLICTKIEIIEADTTPPENPVGIALVSKTDVSATIHWHSSADNGGVEYYNVYVDGKNWAFTTDTAITVFGLKPGSTYSIGISAKDWSGNESSSQTPLLVTTDSWSRDPLLINPFTDLQYCGSFRSPFVAAFGLTFSPHGDPSSSDNWPGSLVMYHPYNEAVGEMTIPAPGDARTLTPEQLPLALALHQPSTVTLFGEITENVSDVMIFGDITYVPPELSGVGYHSYIYGGLQSQAYDKYLTLGAFASNGGQWGNKSGLWWLGSRSGPPYCSEYSSFLFTIPQDWASRDFGGNALFAGGAYREYLGPTLTASAPWAGGAYPPNRSELAWTRLMKYGTYSGENKFPNSIDGFQKGDNFTGGAWAQLDGGVAYGSKNAVILLQYKSRGKNWYGFSDGLMFYDVVYDKPGTFSVNAQRGDYCAGSIRSLIFFDPRQIAEVYKGTRSTETLQPYAFLDLSPWLYDDRIGVEDWEHASIATGIATDWHNGYLYVMERKVKLDDTTKSDIIHSFKLHAPASSTQRATPAGEGLQLHNSPNPFGQVTQIAYNTGGSGTGSISVFTASGKRLFSQSVSGRGVLNWETARYPSGVYLCTMSVGNTSKTLRLACIK